MSAARNGASRADRYFTEKGGIRRVRQSREAALRRAGAIAADRYIPREVPAKVAKPQAPRAKVERKPPPRGVSARRGRWVLIPKGQDEGWNYV